MVIEITDQTFKQEVLSKSELILIDFWAPWCRPCKRFASTIDEMDQEHGDKIKILKLNVDQNHQTAKDYEVMSLPTLILFKNGRPLSRKVGVHTKEQVIQWIRNTYKKQTRPTTRTKSRKK